MERPELTPGLMALVAVTTFAAASGIHYQTPMLGAIATEFGADASAVGWVATLSFAGFLAGILFLAPLGDRVDKRKLIITQHLAAIVALFAAAAAPGLASLAAAAFLIGVCACYAQIIVPFVAELVRAEERGRAVGTVLTALFLGILFARLTGGFVADHLGWRWMYLIAGCMLLALAPALLARLPSSPPKTTLPYYALLASIAQLMRQHAEMRRVFAVQFLLGICYGGFWATIATMLLQQHGLGPTVAGLIGIPGAAGILIARPAGRWMDLRGTGPIVTTGIALIISAYAVFAFGAWWAGALALGAVLLDCGLRATMVANQTSVNSLAADAGSRANTVFGVSVWTGNAAGAFLASTALARGGWLAVCAISVVAASVALGVQLRSVRQLRRP